MPWYVEWLLAFPRAPMGGVSIQIWGIACASVVGLISEAVIAAYALVGKQGTERQAQAFGVGGGEKTPGSGTRTPMSGTGTPRKEL